MDVLNVKRCNNNKNNKNNKNIKIEKHVIQSKPTKPRTRKITPVPDECRCCANTLDGSRCTLKRYAKSGEMCYVHYKKTLPKIENPDVKVSENNNTKTTKWSFLKWW